MHGGSPNHIICSEHFKSFPSGIIISDQQCSPDDGDKPPFFMFIPPCFSSSSALAIDLDRERSTNILDWKQMPYVTGQCHQGSMAGKEDHDCIVTLL